MLSCLKKFILLTLLLSFSFITYASTYHKVALVSSSSSFDESVIPLVKQAFEAKGYEVTTQYLKPFPTELGYSNEDPVRAKILLDAMLDDSVDVLWFMRGGAGALNLLPELQKSHAQLKMSKSKVVVGFSDITAIHAFVNKQLQWPSIHGVVAEFNVSLFALKSAIDKDTYPVSKDEPIPNVSDIMQQGIRYSNIESLNTKEESVSGTLIGGNLTLVESTIGTPFQASFSDKILLLEDTGETYHHLDRSLHHLLMLKDIHKVKAVLFGQFYGMDATDEQRLIYKKVLKNFAKKLNKPVFYYPLFGHGHKNKPFILNTKATIDCSRDEFYCEISER